ncbi:MAG: hypothetical protein WBN29_16815, partial [Polyangiales bacterium]
MSRWVACLVAALILSSCQRDAKPEPSTPPASTEHASAAPSTPTAEPVPEAQVGVARPATAKERAAIDELLQAAESVRQLRLLQRVAIEIEDGDAIAHSLRLQIEE